MKKGGGRHGRRPFHDSLSCTAAKLPAAKLLAALGLLCLYKPVMRRRSMGCRPDNLDKKCGVKTMVANNSVTIIMIVMSYLMVAVVVAAFFMHGPRALDERKKRQIDQLVSGAELLADAISRNGHDPVHLARLQAQYAAHARALTQLGTPVPALLAAPALQQAA